MSITLQTVQSGAYGSCLVTSNNNQDVMVLTTARDDTEENVAKFRTRVAWYKVSACCFFCITAGMTSEIVSTAEDHADRMCGSKL